ARMRHQLAAVESLIHGAFTPEAGGIEEFFVQGHVGDEDAGTVELKAVNDPAVRSDGEAGPFARARGAVVRADPEVIFGGPALHRRRNNGSPNVVFRVGDNAGPGVVERPKQDLHTTLLQCAKKFGEAIVVADADAAG